MAPKKLNKDHDLHSKERNIPIQKNTPASIAGKIKKKKKKRFPADAIPDLLTVKPPLALSDLKDNSKHKKKKNKKFDLKVPADAAQDIASTNPLPTFSALEENSSPKKKKDKKLLSQKSPEAVTVQSPPTLTPLQENSERKKKRKKKRNLKIASDAARETPPTLSPLQENARPKIKKNKKLGSKMSSDPVQEVVSAKSPQIFSAFQENSKPKKTRKLETDAILDEATMINSPPTFSPLQGNSANKKKKPIKNIVEKSQGSHNLSVMKIFDSASNLNDFGGRQTLTDTKSFFKPEILKREECVIQFAQTTITPNLEARNFNHSERNEDTPGTAQEKFDDRYVNGTKSVDELDYEMNDREYDDMTFEDEGYSDVEDTINEDNVLQNHRLPDNKFLVLLKYRKDLFIRGQLNIRVLYGSVEILGWHADDTTDKSYTVFSPRGSGLLKLEPLEHSSENRDQLAGKLTSLGLDSKLGEGLVDELDGTSSLVLFEKSESSLVSFLGKSAPTISLYPASIKRSNEYQLETNLNCEIRLCAHGPSYEKSEEWEKLFDDIADDFYQTGQARAVVCGGKAIGKSTLLRYLVNRNVKAHGEVLYIDFDLGQPEFTMPGCVYAIKITEPLFGPNYTHIRTPERSVYLGQVNVDTCPDRYIEGVKHIIDYCRSIPELRKMVWLINTMGYNKGLGIELNTSIIGLVDPTRVVEIMSRYPKRNFDKPLLPANIVEMQGRWCKPPARLDFKLFQLHSMADGQSNRGLEARVIRNFMMLAYFHTMLGASKNFLSDIIPYSTPLSRLSLGVLYEIPLPADVLNVMNGMLVALCVVDPDVDVLIPDDATLPRVLTRPPLCPCLGFGVVRGIDVSSRTLYLTTPLPASRLAAVNCLLTGMVPLPPTLLLNPKVGPGAVPYVIVGPGQVTSRLVSNKYVVPRRQRQGRIQEPLDY